MNQLTIIGNLTRAPETRTTQSGINVCSFTVAVNRRRQKDGQQEADYFRVSAWREMGENCQKYLGKGSKVAVTGSVSVSTYTTQNGETRANLDVLANNVEFLSTKQESTPKPQEQPKAQQTAQGNGWEEVNDDDLPF